MAKYFTDFSEYTHGAQPSGWTLSEGSTYGAWSVVADGAATGGVVLRYTPGAGALAAGGAASGLLWTALGQFADGEIFGRFRWPLNNWVQRPLRLNANHASAPFVGYAPEVIVFSAARALLKQTAAESFTTISSGSGAGALTAGAWYDFVLTKNGTAISMKVWLHNAGAGDYGESTAFTLSGTSSPALASNFAGIAARGDGASHFFEFDVVGVATTAGETAPRAVHAPDTPTVTVSEIDITSALVTISAYHDADGDPQVARQVRIRRVSDDAILVGPFTLAPGVNSYRVTGLPTAKSPAEEVDSEWVAEAHDSDARGYGAWGTSAEHTTIPLWSSGRGVVHLDVQIEREASGGGTEMQSYRDFGGRNWIKGLHLEPAGVDRPIGSGVLTLFRESAGDSLAPLMTLSDLNRVDGAFSPALDFGREVAVFACLMPPGEEPDTDDWIPMFGGTTDDVSWPRKAGDVSVPFRDYSGALADTIIRDETRYGDPDTPPDALVVMQQVLDDWMGAGQYTLWDLTTGAGFAVTQAIYADISVWEALQNLALQWGGKRLEQRWNPADEEWQLAVIDPDRAKTTPDYAIGPETYLEVHEISTQGRDLRTIVRGECVERATGKLLTSQLPEDADIPSDPLVQLYGPRVLIFREPSDSSPVDTQAELDDEVAAVYADVTSVPYPLEIETKLLPFAAVDDLVTFGANARTHDEDQDAAVLTLAHDFPAPGVGRTRFVTADKPKGALQAWLRRGVEIAGRNARPSIFDLVLTHSPTGTLALEVDVNAQVERWEAFSRLGSSPLTAGVPDDGTSRGSFKRAETLVTSWPVRDGTHHVVVRAYAGDDQRVFAEREETIVITGVGGGGTPGSEAPTVAPLTPSLELGALPGGGTQEVSSRWPNTSDTLAIETEWFVNGVSQGISGTPLAAGTDTENNAFTIGTRAWMHARYTQGPGLEGPWSPPSRAILLSGAV